MSSGSQPRLAGSSTQNEPTASLARSTFRHLCERRFEGIVEVNRDHSAERVFCGSSSGCLEQRCRSPLGIWTGTEPRAGGHPRMVAPHVMWIATGSPLRSLERRTRKVRSETFFAIVNSQSTVSLSPSEVFCASRQFSYSAFPDTLRRAKCCVWPAPEREEVSANLRR
jgi:hypothetical protein